MELSAYLTLRTQIQLVAVPFALSGASLSLALIWACTVSVARRHAARLAGALVGLFIVGFAILAFYHLRIYQTVVLVNPATGEVAGRFAVPMWIETEKLFFETLLLGVLALVVMRRARPLSFAVGALFGVLGLATALLANPFTSPLPDLHRQLLETASALGSSDTGLQMRAFGQAFSQMRFFYNSAYMWIHPPLLFASYAAFTVSFVSCLFMLRSPDRGNEKSAYDYAKLGYLMLTFGILIGYPWAIAAWKGSPWWWAPKINMALMLWFLYTGYLHSRLYLQRRGMWKTTAILGIACFLALVLTYATTYVVPGTHSVA
jgi:cytochrome c biogenesis factor